MNDLLDTLQSLADGLDCMSITNHESGVRWAVSEIKKLRAENETLKREAAAEEAKYIDEIARLWPTDAELEAVAIAAKVLVSEPSMNPAQRREWAETLRVFLDRVEFAL